MDAVILAGGQTPEKLSAALAGSTPTERALLKINNRAAIEWVLDSLQNVSQVENIFVVGLPQTFALLEKTVPHVRRLPAGSTLVENVLSGMNAAASQSVLICTCDIPLVTEKTWREFLGKVAAQNLQAAYPIASRERVEQIFPEGQRTYATLIEGTFTGGNAFVLPRENREELRTLIDTAYRARKNPLGLARLLGAGFLFKAIRKKLAIADVERKMSHLLNCRAGAVEMDDVTLAFDIDKKEDYDLAQNFLSATPEIKVQSSKIKNQKI
jgi:molybdopterin-guanine dinucleotide biosynthesis protein A